MDNELMHHGVPGMKWGVRRYQNKDGSLTYAGKKRALKMRDRYTEFSKDSKFRDKEGNLTYKGRKKNLKMQEQYSALTGKRLTKFQNKGDSSDDKTSSKSNPKSVKNMTDQELRDKIARTRLENEYKSLHPEPEIKEGAGKRLMKTAMKKTTDKLIEKGAAMAGDYFDKQLRDKLGISIKDKKSQLEELKNLASEYENRKKIDEAQKYFKEGKYAEKKPNKKSDSDDNNTSTDNSKKDKGPERVKGTVVDNGKKSHQPPPKSKPDDYYDPIDMEYEEVKSHANSGKSFVKVNRDTKWSTRQHTELANVGKSYINKTFLLEDKERR